MRCDCHNGWRCSKTRKATSIRIDPWWIVLNLILLIASTTPLVLASSRQEQLQLQFRVAATLNAQLPYHHMANPSSPNKDDTATTQADAAAREAALRRMTTRAAGSAITHSTTAAAASSISGPPQLLQQHDQQQRRDPIYLYSSLVAGMGSGAVSAVVCAPLDLVRTRLQVWGDIVVVGGGSKSGGGGISSSSSRLAVMSMFRDIVQRDGIKGCFRGLTATLLTVPFFWGVYCEYIPGILVDERVVLYRVTYSVSFDYSYTVLYESFSSCNAERRATFSTGTGGMHNVLYGV